MSSLSKVSIWATVGRKDPLLLERTLRMLRYVDSLHPWQSKTLITALDPAHYAKPAGLQVIQIPELDPPGWQIFVAKIIPQVIKNHDWTLSLHDDGLPIDMSLWEDAWLGYDYIGAPWPDDGTVGSAGCCLASWRFNSCMTQLPWWQDPTTQNADEFVCRTHREQMLRWGCRFAPAEVAVKFCTEVTDNEQPSFAYHGRNHAVEKHKQAWAQIEAWENARKHHGTITDKNENDGVGSAT